jgi:glucosamine--fructose-6-phosphate aminotransferase (isomerizing)
LGADALDGPGAGHIEQIHDFYRKKEDRQMCGIVGYVGSEQAAPILLHGLSKLEYRGYDSAGLAVRDGVKNVEIVKAKGRLKVLAEKTNDGKALLGTCGIGHTRWATHGEPSELNAHPHCSDDENVVAVHNGIIENYQELKEKLLKHGYTFYSATDTEVAVKLIDYYYKKYAGTPVDAINHAMVRIRGSYALAVMFKDYPEEIYAARKDSPMIIGITHGEDGKEGAAYLASDVPAILNYTRHVYYIGNMEMARLRKGEVTFFNLDGDEIEKELTEVKWDAEAAEKAGFEHFMMKEIHEQPKAVADTFHSVLKDGRINLEEMGLTEEAIKEISQIVIVACGSAYHVGMVTQYVMEDLARIPVRVELASEFRYRRPILTKDTLVIVVSQSGETADSLAALREAKNHGVKTLAIVNVVGSSIAREADYVFYTLAGPEISVATTKAYSAQLIAGYCLSMEFGRVRGQVDQEAYDEMLAELETIPDKITKILEDRERIQWFASKQVAAQNIFFIGRGIDYAISMEGSLKLKEISYIHSEAYAAGELKHGTISLIEDGTLVIGVLTQSGLYEKTLSNMVECKSRGAYLMGLTSYGHYNIEDTADFTIYVPKTDEHFAASLAVVPLQLLGYYVSVAKGLDVDKPRNLAKSVTVE